MLAEFRSSKMKICAPLTDSEAFGAIYFYSYTLIVLAILFGAVYFATRVPLFYQTHQACIR